MRNLDFSPLYRSTVGFDRLAKMVDQALTADVPTATYPPYNIEKTGEHSYRITLAAAGFAEEDISIESREGVLLISGARPAKEEGEESPVYLHRGIAERSFERRFQLADHVKATGASMANGLLHVDVEREVPEALKPRKIAINASKARRKIKAA